ncbi:MAG: DUF4835 family protein [Bacteroidetes bacterium]|nr:DUF4835 family protein [Bacteroidota bacterium]
MHHQIKVILLCFFSLLLSKVAHAQELRCEVKVNTAQIAQADQSIFEGFESGVREFMNNTKWTEEEYEEFEKIQCQIFINVTNQEKSATGQIVPNSYSGTVTIIAQRRIYNSAFDSPLLNHQDKAFSFTYLPNQAFFFSENASQSNLTSVLAFYAYLIIGLDKDGMAPKGGDAELLKAQAVVNNSQNLSEPGWRSTENNNNRYWIINDYLNQAFSPLRDLYYDYHRLGMDVLVSDFKSGRIACLKSLEKLDKIWDQRPNAFLLQVFFNAKRQEIINILKNAPAAEKAVIIPILKKTDPAQGAKYDEAAR